MRNFFLLLLLISNCSSLFAQNKDEQAILNILDQQTISWNKGDIDHFMDGYWKNDSLMFIGKNGITYGYTNTLNNYKKNYSDAGKMGQLKFTILHLNKLSSDTYFVVGKWYLTRTIGNIGGHYTLCFKKINGQWLIISDHSS